MKHEIYIIRHGQTEWNAAGRMQGGTADSPLTARGRAQVVAMADCLAARGVTAESHLFLASPQGRTLETAAAIARRLDARFTLDPRLREIDMGPFAGLTHDEIAARFPGAFEEQHPCLWYDTIPGGEGLAALQARAIAAVHEIDRPAVIVTHGMTSRMLRAAYLGRDHLFAATEMEGGQGILFRLADGAIERIQPPTPKGPETRP
ncbi:histidine phosphatase family protein [Frigidibacter sp. SD6-1]|uniref:histidine phosphatase family protein n=1 Tax=Frigidibacter sp. SD6-1 TaxID=3032581 RepID=UPI0024DF7218|nr:histidine phosphatase family protein [Frigidibacter sp. SD6-1]